MYVYDKKQRLQRHYAGGGIFDTIKNVVTKIASNSSIGELGKKAIAKAGTAAGEKIVNAIKKRRQKKLNAKSQAILQKLSLAKDVLNNNNISNILEGSGQAIAY